MPIVGSTSNATFTIEPATLVTAVSPGCTFTRRLPTAGRLNFWFHSSVFLTDYGNLTTYERLNVADLTTVFTPAPSCQSRWMLPSAEPRCGDGISVIAPVTQNFTVFSVDPASSIVSDASYSSCQLYATPTYSPGVCPSGHTVAEITAYQSNVSTGYHTFWQASCCRSGMTFGPEYADACVSSFSTPLQAYAAITTTPGYSGAEVTPVWEYTSYSYPETGDPVSTVVSTITTITSGLAVADPVLVAWQIHDIGTFPTDYVESLVERFGIVSPASTPTSLSGPTTTPQSNGLSIGAQIGIGVGVALGAVIVGGLIVLWFLRRRRKLVSTETQDPTVPEMEDQDHSHRQRKWFIGGRWRSEVGDEDVRNELDSKAVHVVPGPPAELEASEPHMDANDSGQGLETAERSHNHV